MCGGGQTTTSSSQPPQVVQNAYQNLINQGTQVASLPLNQYSGNLVAGFTPDQMSAFQTIDNSQGVADPYINASAQLASQAATPITPTQFSAGAVQQYESPYTQDVVNSTLANINQENAEQQQQVVGNSIQQGAFGGDRQAIAQSELAQQQALASNQTIANLENQNYSQALGEFNTQQQTGMNAQEASNWLASNAGFQMGALGNEAQTTALNGASAQLQSGALQQQLAQEELNIPYEEFLQQQAYPFETTNYLAGLVEGAGSGLGGTSSTTEPSPSAASQIAGLGLTGLAAYGLLAMRRGGGVRAYDNGGTIPGFSPVSPDIPDVSVSIVPTPMTLRGPGAPAPPRPAAQESPTQQGLGALQLANAVKGLGGSSGATGYMGTLPGGFGEVSSADMLGDMGYGALPAGSDAAAMSAMTGMRRGGVPRMASGGAPVTSTGNSPMIAGFTQSPGRGIAIPVLATGAPSSNGTAGFAPVNITPTSFYSAPPVSSLPYTTAPSRLPATSPTTPTPATPSSPLMYGDSSLPVDQWATSGIGPGGTQWGWRGGRIHHATGGIVLPETGGMGFDNGGQVASAGMMGAGMPAANGNPMVANLIRQYSQMPTEKLQEYAVRVPPTSAYGQAVRLALQMRHMSPGSDPSTQQQAGFAQAPQSAVAPQSSSGPQPTGQTPPPGTMHRGGVAGFADGGAPPIAGIVNDAYRIHGGRDVVARDAPKADYYLQSWQRDIDDALKTRDPNAQYPDADTVAKMMQGITIPSYQTPTLQQWEADTKQQIQNAPSAPVAGFADGGVPGDDSVVDDDSTPRDIDVQPLPPPTQGQPPENRGTDIIPPPRTDATLSGSQPNDLNPVAGLSAPPPTHSDTGSDSATTGKNGILSSPWYPVLAAGLGMLSSRSPFASVGIGRGGLEGLQAAVQQQELGPKLDISRAQAKGEEAEAGLKNLTYRGYQRMQQGWSGVDTRQDPDTVARNLADHADKIRKQMAPDGTIGAVAGKAPVSPTDLPALGEGAPAALASVSAGTPRATPVGAPGTSTPQSAGAAPLFDIPSLYQQYRTAAGTPGMEKVASQILSLLEKDVPEGAYMGADGGIYLRPHAAQTFEQTKAAQAKGEAPYKIIESIASRAGTPIPLKQNETAVSGVEALPPEARGAISWAAHQIGVGAPDGTASGAPGAQGRASGAPSPMTGATAPSTSSANATGNPDIFSTEPIHNPDGSIASPYTESTIELQKQSAADYANARKAYQNSMDLNFRLDMMDHAVDTLNQTGWSSTGTGANARIGLAKTMNSLESAFGMKPTFDPTKIGTWEDFNKESTRAGFELARSLGSREAMMIVQQATSAVPNSENTYLGARLVSSSLRQAAQRQADYYKFATQWATNHRGNTFGADIAFNDQSPPGLYAKRAIVNAVPDRAITYLKNNPKLAGQFDQMFGQGTAEFVLNGGR